ncbi:PAAR domain-containing protein [Cupriavidus necator H16]|uniref:PAAR domain-containing protein n=2 Tax=Cupriavidus necator (strain ATCC 17699 / DSM 428 / KCTC 22496 / NCIMB 10442 / H16 / Stanier 337) TaxID=381666 RepID=A0AAE5ZHS5_CUPNH|nr:PAAR domain-containing protein [Cupriavidus necator]QCC02059.1 PAAR domain-containing protein [Cupriavidus necator H16]QQB75107.1 PAAR domain-containing protein [Cupriavidus necator]WKA40463.1 PAAR domain-containing protein [Cupriavidus necator]
MQRLLNFLAVHSLRSMRTPGQAVAQRWGIEGGIFAVPFRLCLIAAITRVQFYPMVAICHDRWSFVHDKEKAMPDIRYALKNGDPTSTGGQLMAHTNHMIHHGVSVGVEGDIATCPACKSSGSVVNDCYPAFDLFGKQILVSGARVNCQCADKPFVFPTQNDFTIEVSRSGYDQTQTSSNAIHGGASEDRASVLAYDERFVIRDASSQEPVPSIAYAIRRGNGEIEHGTTDADGHTHLLSSVTQSEDVAIYVEG